MKKTATDSTYYVRDFLGSTVYEFKNTYAPTNLQYVNYFGGSGDVIGQWLNDGGTWKDYYWLKDHLGNTRVVVENFNGTPNVANATDYYPFGAELRSMPSSNIVNEAGQKFKYAAQEIYYETSYINFGARFYDPSIGRMVCTDPLQGKYVSINPYQYICNNPVNGIELDGRETFFVNGIFSSTYGAFNDEFRNDVTNNIIKGGQRTEFVDPYPNYLSDILQGLLLPADARFALGQNNARQWLEEKLAAGFTIGTDGKLYDPNGNGEYMNFVTHSSGAAFAEGMASYFESKGVMTDNMFHFSPYNGEGIDQDNLAKAGTRISFISKTEFGMFSSIMDWAINPVQNGQTVKGDAGSFGHINSIQKGYLGVMSQINKIVSGQHNSLNSMADALHRQFPNARIYIDNQQYY